MRLLIETKTYILPVSSGKVINDQATSSVENLKGERELKQKG